MTDKTYNGWTNWETWNVNLWMSDMLDDMHNDGQEITADYIVEWVLEELDRLDPENGMLKDLLQGAIEAVNFHEIASHYQDED